MTLTEMLTFWFCRGFLLGHFSSRAKSFSDIIVLGLDKNFVSFSSLFRMWKIFSDIFTHNPRPGIYAVLVRARPGWDRGSLFWPKPDLYFSAMMLLVKLRKISDGLMPSQLQHFCAQGLKMNPLLQEIYG